MTWRAQIDDHGVVTRYKDLESGKVISAADYEKQQQQSLSPGSQYLSPTTGQAVTPYYGNTGVVGQQLVPPPPVTTPLVTTGGSPVLSSQSASAQQVGGQFVGGQPAVQAVDDGQNPLIQPGAQILGELPAAQAQTAQAQTPIGSSPTPVQGKNLRMEGLPHPMIAQATGFRTHGFLDATSIAILIPTLIILTLIIAAAHKKRLFPWQTLRPFNPPTGLMTPREYERSYLCPPNARRAGKLGKRDPNATWTDEDGTVLPFGFLARTHLPVTIPLGRLPNKNMFIVAPSGSGKTTLMRAIIKGMLARPCVIVALEAKANDPNLDELKEGFKFTVLPAAQEAGFAPLYFNPLDESSVYWNPLDLDPITFSSSLIPNLNMLDPEEQHWAERDHGYITGLATLLKWGAVMVSGEDESGMATDVQPLPCNPRGLMRLVNNRRNIVESLRRLRTNPDVDPMELSELSLTLSSIIRTDTDWDKNIQGVRGRLRMFKNPNVLRVTEHSSIDLRRCMFEPTVLIFGAPASLGPDAESLADCFVYQLQQALHSRYGTASVLPLFAFFDEYQTLNLDIAGRLSAIVRGANGGLTVILQNVSQITGTAMMREGTMAGMAELKTIFSNSAIRICLHNADDTTARFFSDEIGKHAVVIPGVSDHFGAGGFATFPTAWNRIHSQQVVARVDTDAIKRMEAFHGLLYLSPAGGAFGEVKPLMVDLRGIEEIARIHLLHSKRAPVTPDSSGTATPGGAAPETVASGGAGTSPAAETGTSTGEAASVATEASSPAAGLPMFAAGALAAEAVSNIAGIKQTEVEHDFAATKAPEVERDVTGVVDGITPLAEAPDSEGLGGGAKEDMSKDNLTDATHKDMQEKLAQVAAAARPSTIPPAVSASQPVAASALPAAVQPTPRRICPFCGNIAGRGKFCISCGKPMDATSDAPLSANPTPESVAPESFQKPRLTSDMVSPYPPSKSVATPPAAQPASKPITQTASAPTATAPVAPPVTQPASTPATQPATSSTTTPSYPMDAEVNSAGLRRIPPSMPSVYGIRSHHSLSPRMAPSSPPNNSTSSDSNSTDSTGSAGPSIAFRTVNPSWTKHPPQ
jgi:hypothetical protein